MNHSLEKIVEEMTEMELHSVVTSCTGEWLDSWGKWFGVPRESGEEDATYRPRILESVTMKKVTIPALIDAVKRALGADTAIQIEETYQDLRIWNVSTYSGTGKYQDSDTIRLGIVRIIINKEPNDRLREEIWKTKASGVRVIFEVRLTINGGNFNSPYIGDGLDGGIFTDTTVDKIVDGGTLNGR